MKESISRAQSEGVVRPEELIGEAGTSQVYERTFYFSDIVF